MKKEPVWIYIENPSEEDIEVYSEKYGLEIGHLTDALDPYEAPRFETEGDAAYIFTRVPQEINGNYSTAPILFVLRKEMLLTLCRHEINFFTDAKNKENELKKEKSIQLFIYFSNKIIDAYYQAATRINKQVITVSANVDHIENQDIIRFVAYEQVINEFLNAVIQTNLIIKSLLSSKKILSDEEIKDSIEDLFLSTGQLVEFLKSSLQTVKNMRDAYSTILTNNLNRIIKFFTTLTIICTIPTIISSFFGMNVSLPFAEHPLAFLLIFAVTVCISIFFLLLFQKKNWL